MIHHHHAKAAQNGTIWQSQKPLPAPEIDPSAGLSAVLLLAGLLAVLLGRRRA